MWKKFFMHKVIKSSLYNMIENQEIIKHLNSRRIILNLHHTHNGIVCSHQKLCLQIVYYYMTKSCETAQTKMQNSILHTQYYCNSNERAQKGASRKRPMQLLTNAVFGEWDDEWVLFTSLYIFNYILFKKLLIKEDHILSQVKRTNLRSLPQCCK